MFGHPSWVKRECIEMSARSQLKLLDEIAGTSSSYWLRTERTCSRKLSNHTETNIPMCSRSPTRSFAVFLLKADNLLDQTNNKATSLLAHQLIYNWVVPQCQREKKPNITDGNTRWNNFSVDHTWSVSDTSRIWLGMEKSYCSNYTH